MHQIRCKKKECEISDQLRVTRNNFKNSFSCLLDIVTCDRGVGRRTPFIRNKGCDNILSQPLLRIKVILDSCQRTKCTLLTPLSYLRKD